jgi:hypothetical protein
LLTRGRIPAGVHEKVSFLDIADLPGDRSWPFLSDPLAGRNSYPWCRNQHPESDQPPIPAKATK